MPCTDAAMQIYTREEAAISGSHSPAICSLTVRAGLPSSVLRLCWSTEDHARVASLLRDAIDAIDASIDDARAAERAAAAEPVIARALGEPTGGAA